MKDDTPSLFSRLLSTRESRESPNGVKGHEEYLTQIMAFLLQQDDGLAQTWILGWFGVEGAQDIDVAPEDTADSSNQPELPDSSIDVRVSFTDTTGNKHRAYVENKVEAKLNQYQTSDGKAFDQVQKYTKLLDAVCGKSGEQGHIIVCGLRPQVERQERLTERVRWHPPKYWWDFYEIVKRYVEGDPNGPPAVRWLQREFLSFCEQKKLDTPKPLSPATTDEEAAARLLGLAAVHSRAVEGIVVTTKPQSSPGTPWTATVYFDAKRPSEPTRARYWVSLTGDGAKITSRAYWENVGDMPLPVPAGFWSKSPELDGQRDALATSIRVLPTTKCQFDRVIGSFIRHRNQVERLLDALWKTPGVCVTPNQHETEIRAISVNFPTGVEIVIGQTASHGAEVRVNVTNSAAQKAAKHIAKQILGKPNRPASTRLPFPISTEPNSLRALAIALQDTESS